MPIATSAASAASEAATERTVANATRHHTGGRCGGEKSIRAQDMTRSVTSGEVAMHQGYGSGLTRRIPREVESGGGRSSFGSNRRGAGLA